MVRKKLLQTLSFLGFTILLLFLLRCGATTDQEGQAPPRTSDTTLPAAWDGKSDYTDADFQIKDAP